MPRPHTPDGGYQTPGDYVKGNNVWVEDGGKLLCADVDRESSNTEQEMQEPGGQVLSKIQTIQVATFGK